MDKPEERWMSRAAVLTREGRVLEATRAIQEGLGMLRAKPADPPIPPRAAPRAKWLSGIGSLVRTRALPIEDAIVVEPASAVEPASPVVIHSAFEAATHHHGGLTRRFKLFVPSRPAASPMLVVMLHGCTQDPDDFALGTGMNERAERDGFLVLYPQQSRGDNPSACWNWFNRKDQRRDAGEAGFLADLVRTVVQRHGIDPGRVHVAGLSAGGAMAEILAAEYPDLFAAAAVHSGLPAGAAGNVPDALNAMRGGRPKPAVTAVAQAARVVPTIVLHGDADTTVHPANGDAVVRAVLGRSTRPATPQAATVGATPRYTRTRHVLDDGTALVEHWVLHGAGHAWAGGRAQGSFTDPRGIDATDHVLRFFDEHRR